MIGPVYWWSPTVDVDRTELHGYDLRISRDRRPFVGGATLHLTHADAPPYSRSEWAMSWEAIDGLRRGAAPVVVVRSYTGGAHCCATAHLVALGDGGAREFQVIEGGHGQVRFERLPSGDVIAEAPDWTFAYGEVSFAESPAGMVTLRWDGERFAPSAEDMRRPAPRAEDLAALAEDHRRRFGSSTPLSRRSGMWGMMLDLIYAGHADLAWRFCDEAWPGRSGEKLTFLEDFHVQLRRSPYLDVLVELNGDRLQPPNLPPPVDAAP